MKRKLLTTIAALSVLSAATTHAASIVVDSAIYQLVGPSGAAIPSGGVQNNGVTNFSTGAVAGYKMYDTTTSTYFGMVVSASNPTGPVTISGSNSLMVAQTVNSQGLTDPGTLSVYVWVPDTTTSQWTLDINFSFYALDSGGTAIDMAQPINKGLLLTSLDIDNGQKYYVQSSDFGAGSNTYTPTALTAAPPIGGYTGWTATSSSTFNNPAYAVSSGGTGQSFDIRLAHNNKSLFMFEFRDPSSIVPEPSSAFLAGLGSVVLVGFMRRLRRTA